MARHRTRSAGRYTGSPNPRSHRADPATAARRTIALEAMMRGTRTRDRAIRRWLGMFVTAAMLLTVALPPGDALPGARGFPLSWLWHWLDRGPDWAASVDGVPRQESAGTAAGHEHHASGDSTRAGGGAGRAPGKAPAR